MRLKTKGGVPPCDRRIDRRKVAFAALAALFLSASVAKAGVVEFVIDSTKSQLKQTLEFKTYDAINDVYVNFAGPSVPQFPAGTLGGGHPGSDVATLNGGMFVDLVGATFRINPTGVPSGAGINLTTMGNYVPFDPVTSDPPGPIGTTPGNFGHWIAVPDPNNPPTGPPGIIGTGGWLPFFVGNFYGMKATMTMPGYGPMAGTNLAGLPLPLTEGWLSSWSGLAGGDSGSIAGLPGAILGTAGSANATLIGDTLTIPVNSAFPTPIGSGLYLFTYVTGQIVAHPRVPEPSSFVLLGFGVIGLIAAARRARRSK